MHLPTTELDLSAATGRDGSTDSTAGHLCLELPAEHVSAPSVTQGFEREVAAGISEGSTSSAAHPEGSTPALLSPVAESQASPETKGEAQPSPELPQSPSVSTGSTEVTEVSQSSALQSDLAWEEKEDAPQISPDTLLENLPNTSDVSELQSERDANRNLMPSVIFLSSVVSLSIVLQEPSTLFFIGLLFVLNRL